FIIHPFPMSPDPVEFEFDGKRPWRTLFRLYLPERRSVVLAMLTYLVKASPLWILPVITANIIDFIAHGQSNGLDLLWKNAAVGCVAIVLNVPSAMLYVRFLSRAVRTV